MDCKNHPGTAAVARCAGCAEAFCPNCLVEIGGKHYCGSCKVLAIHGQPIAEEATMPCAEAKQALIYSIVGLFICGIILGPVAISKAIQAKRQIAEDPRLTGSGQATAALIIAIIALILWAIAMLARVSEFGRR